MTTIQGISDQPQQQITVPLTGGSTFLLTLSYSLQQGCWFYSISWNGTAVCNGQRLVTSPNILRKYQNVVPFGISVVTNGDIEPSGIEDLDDGTATLYLLQGSDIALANQLFYGAPAGQVQPTITGPGGSQSIIPPASWGPASGDLQGDYPDPSVVALHASGQQLTLGPISDGQFLKRVGSTIVGANSSGAGDVVGPAGSVAGHFPGFADATGLLLDDSGYGPSSFDAAGTAATLAAAAQTAAEAASYPGLGPTPFTALPAIAASTLLGNPTGGSHTPEAVTLGTGLSFSGTTLNATAVASPYLNEYNVNTYQSPAHAPYTVASPGGGAAANLTAINYAIADMITAGGGRLLFPGSGIYNVNGALTPITVPCEVCGNNWGTTVLSQSSGDGFSFQSGSPSYIHDIDISGPSNASNTGLIFGSSSLANSSSTVERVQILTFFIGIAAANTINNFLVSNSTFGCTHSIVVGGVNSAGTAVVTAGGSFAGSAAMILNCTTSGTTTGVLCLAPNGVLIQGCEMVATVTAINCIFQNTTAAMSDIWIIANHIECSGTGVILDGATNTVTTANHYKNVLIVGNEFLPAGPGLWGIQMASGNTGNAWMQTLTIVGNSFANCPSGCVTLYSTTNGCVMSNTFLTNVATTQLLIDASCSQVLGAAQNSYPNGSGGASGGYVDNQTYTVAKLNSASKMKGARMFVTDSTQTLAAGIGTNVAGTGSHCVPVFSDGSNWLIG